MQLLPRLLLPLMIVALASACDAFGSREKRGDDNVPDARWVCDLSLQSDGCMCEKLKPGWESSGSDSLQCLAHQCCLLNESETESSTASCVCHDDVPDCAAEASSRRDTRVVSQCPPSDEAPAQACAQPGENCRQDYLEQQQLAGCCEGTICAANDVGVPVCRAASAQESELWRQCDKTARASSGNVLPLTDGALVTSAGTIQFDSLRTVSLQVGPGGCLRGLSGQLEAGGIGCSISVDVGVQSDRLVVQRMSSILASCPGIGGPLNVTSRADSVAAQTAVDFTFEGVACDGHLVFESYCLAGRFDFHFHGAANGITLGDDHVTLEGVICGLSEPQGACPQASAGQ